MLMVVFNCCIEYSVYLMISLYKQKAKTKNPVKIDIYLTILKQYSLCKMKYLLPCTVLETI